MSLLRRSFFAGAAFAALWSATTAAQADEYYGTQTVGSDVYQVWVSTDSTNAFGTSPNSDRTGYGSNLSLFAKTVSPLLPPAPASAPVSSAGQTVMNNGVTSNADGIYNTFGHSPGIGYSESLYWNTASGNPGSVNPAYNPPGSPNQSFGYNVSQMNFYSSGTDASVLQSVYLEAVNYASGASVSFTGNLGSGQIGYLGTALYDLTTNTPNVTPSFTSGGTYSIDVQVNSTIAEHSLFPVEYYAPLGLNYLPQQFYWLFLTGANGSSSTANTEIDMYGTAFSPYLTPEPSSLILALAATPALWWCVRRRRGQA